jgi:hypothetical protein
MTNIAFGNVVLTNTGGFQDLFLVRYDSAGNVLWARGSGGPDTEHLWGIAVDASGSCFIGAANGGAYPLSFGGCAVTKLGLAKYDRNGNVVWCKQVTYSSNHRDFRHAVDKAGNLYFLGLFEGTVNLGGVTLTNQVGYPTYFLFRLNPDGQTVWARQFGGSDFSAPYNEDVADRQGGVAVNSAGDCSVAGMLSVTNAIFDSFTLSPAGDQDIFVARFEADPPRLGITPFGASLIISWPTNQSEFALESTVGLGPASDWQAVTNVPEVIGMEKRVTQSLSTNSSYFRLRKL